MSNISQSDIGKVLLQDLSHQTVSRSEMRCGAALIASARHDFEIMKSLAFHPENTGWSICLHAYRQDATNGSRKLCAMELDSAFITNVSEEDSTSLTWESFTRVKRLADLVPVGDETGLGCLGITLRGLRSLGCPSWRDLLHEGNTESLDDDDGYSIFFQLHDISLISA